MKPKKERKKRENMRSFEADPDVAKMLDIALAKGARITDLANAALRAYGPSVIRDLSEQLKQAADEMQKIASKKDSSPN